MLLSAVINMINLVFLIQHILQGQEWGASDAGVVYARLFVLLFSGADWVNNVLSLTV